MATELIPYKGVFLIMAYITVPLLHILLKGVLSYKSILIIFILASCGALYLAYYFYAFIKYVSFEGRISDKVMINF
jgi:hypothetical protein